jgi:hypothetical protein
MRGFFIAVASLICAALVRWRWCGEKKILQSLVLNQPPAKVATAEPIFGLAISSKKIYYMTVL